jgi:predicted membrane-bound mannosyltransferase
MKYQIINKRFTDITVALLLTIGAVSIRLPGLGKWCLTSDEFFLYKPVEYILQKGIPEFPGGGYYVRGLLLQYLITIPLAIFHNKEFALRLFPLIFGVLTIPLFYIFCRKFMDKYPSFICSLLLVFSSWHIEFSRFGRFYTAFQFLFFLFIYLFHTGYWENIRKYQISSWVVAFITIFVFEASIFIPFIILIYVFLINYFRLNDKMKIELFIVSIFLIMINLIVNNVDYTTMGVSNLYPIEYVQANAGRKTGLLVFLSFDLHKSIFQHD